MSRTRNDQDPKLRVIIRSGDAKNFMRYVEYTGAFEYSQWGTPVIIKYTPGEDMPFKIEMEGKTIKDKRYQDIIKFVFNNRKSINVKIKQLQGYDVKPLYKYGKIEISKLNEIYTRAYTDYFLDPCRDKYFYYIATEQLTKEIINESEFKALKEEAFIKFNNLRKTQLGNLP